MIEPTFIDTFLADNGLSHANCHKIAGDASARQYMRLMDEDQRYILMDARQQPHVVAPFIAAANELEARGLTSPKIIAKDLTAGLLLTEDFGTSSLRHAITEYDPHEIYDTVVDALVQIQTSPAPSTWPRTMAARLPEECQRFLDWYMPHATGHSIADQPRKEFMDFWAHTLAPSLSAPPVFSVLDMIHDNLFWLPSRTGTKRIGFIDIQDAVLGPAVYDLASLVYDVRCPVDPPMAQAMVSRFAAATGARHKDIQTQLVLWSTQRNFKILGTFVRLSVQDGKSAYLTHIPQVWSMINEALAHPALKDMALWVKTELPDKMSNFT